MERLPPELLRVVLRALDAGGLIRVAACGHIFEALSNEVAKACCRTQRKGLWCLSMSWRVQLRAERHGRMFRSTTTRVLRQHGSAGRRRAVSNKPVAVAVLPAGLC